MGSGPWLVVLGFSMVIYTPTMVQTTVQPTDWCPKGALPPEKLNDTAMFMKKVISQTMNTTATNGNTTKNETSDDICKLAMMGDQFLSKVQAEELYNCLNPKIKKRTARSIYNFDNLPTFKWSFPIRYTVAPEFTSVQKRQIEEAMEEWASKTCASFREVAPNEQPSHYVEFQQGRGCISFVGRVDRQPQPLYLDGSCFRYLTVAHEIGHVLGLWHTHQRSDRSEHVRLNRDNIRDDEEGNFIEIPPQLLSRFTEYNYASVMHYDPLDLSDIGLPVLETENPLYQNTIGQRVEISHLDAKAVNLAYCRDRCDDSGLSPDCQHGGYQDPRNCSVCICPDGWTGGLCQTLAPSKGDTCGGVLTATSTPKSVTSPRYVIGSGYPQAQECTWRIQTDTSRPIRFRFIEKFGVFCTPDTSTCHDWVEIRFNSTHELLAPRFCCDTTPKQTFTAETDDVMVIFRSLDTTSASQAADRRGFKLEYFVDQVRCDPNLCENEATCLTSGDDLCACPEGYTGRTCGTKIIDPCDTIFCRNGGTCVTLNDGTGQCVCPSGYTGRFCQIEPPRCSSSPCQAGGTCLPLGNRICVCPSDRTGAVCETEIPDPCDSGPCQNRGTCMPTRRTYFCVCPPGFRGFRCEIVPPPDPCLTARCVNAQCVRQGTTATCVCNPGMTGPRCTTVIPPCSSLPCRNGGSCSSRPGSRLFSCACPRGFSGPTCTQIEMTPCSPTPCLNGGTCLIRGTSFRCVCTLGRGGARCEQMTNACGSNPCTRGICMALTGNRYRCMCGGVPCDGNTGVNVCTSRPCRNGGRCVTRAGTNSRTCVCMRGFTGDSCQIRLPSPSACSPNPCKNGGTCRVRGSTYQCLCTPGLLGRNCQHGNCGACGAPVGQVREPCVQTRASQSACTRTITYYTRTHYLIFFHRTVRKTRTAYYRCTRQVPQWSTARCCDNAKMFTDGRGRLKCVVEGNRPFTTCSGLCGGCGTSTRQNYTVRTSGPGRGSLDIRTQRQPCNTAVCRSCSAADRIKCICQVPCCPGFRQVGGQCVRRSLP